MKKTALSLVALVGLIGLFSLFNFFINSPSGQYAYSSYSGYGLKNCQLIQPDTTLDFDTCVKQGFSICDARYFKEPGDMMGWDYCYPVCKRYVLDSCTF